MYIHRHKHGGISCTRSWQLAIKPVFTFILLLALVGEREQLCMFHLNGVFHFSPLSNQMCDVCSMLLPNKCSFRAHERIHTRKSPYCCPECGAPCRSSDLQKHVKENCLHYARKAWYK